MGKKKEEVKVITSTKTSKVETLDEVVPETKEIPVTPEVKVEETGQSKGKKILGEVKAFFILALLIGLVVLGTWYWYTHIYDASKNNNNTTPASEEEYKVATYVSKESHHDLFVLGDYLIERSESYVVKVMNLKGEDIYTEGIECSSVYLGVDNKVYFVLEESGDYENSITLYRVEDKKLVEVTTITTKGVFYSPLVYNDGKTIKLMGYVGDYLTQDDEGEDQSIEYIHLLNDKKYEVKDGVRLYGNVARTGTGQEITTVSDKYIVTEKGSNYGVYDLVNGKNVIEPTYSIMKSGLNNNFVAVKDGKAGIIDANKKIIVDFQYDFIDVNDGFYVVCKNNKLAIMDSSNKLVTGFDFVYQSSYMVDNVKEVAKYNYYMCCAMFNTFEAYKIGDNYVLVINNFDSVKYDKNEAYVIHKDGKFDVIEEKNFGYVNGLIYSISSDKKVTIYDDNIKEKFVIDLSRYDAYSITAKLVNENTIVINLDGNNLYYNYENGEELKGLLDFEKGVNTFKLSYSNGKLVVKTSSKNDTVVDLDQFDYYYLNKIDDNHYYYISDTSNNSIYVMIYKGE